MSDSVATTTKYTPKSYIHLIGMNGFSEKLLTTHFKLYEGYVANTNTVLEKLGALPLGSPTAPEFAELKRRLGWEFNGMRLHELYFDNMGGKEPLTSQPALVGAIKDQFGDLEKWKSEFVTTGTMRGIGWVILYKDPISQRLFNTWVEEHHIGHFSGCQPLLIMDVFEHAFITDYGLDRKKYIDAFLSNANWDVVAQRLGKT